MVTILANSLQTFPTQIIILFSPLIGVLGAFVTGSATVSNILFSPIQSQTAISAGLNPVDLLSLQSVGSAYGNMVSIGNILAVIAVTGIKNSEGKILKINLVVMGGYTLLVLIGFAFLNMPWFAG
jgi:lactate permease